MKYEIYVPVEETWIFMVEASSKEEAMALYLEHSSEVSQNCSISGHPYSKTTVVLVEEDT